MSDENGHDENLDEIVKGLERNSHAPDNPYRRNPYPKRIEQSAFLTPKKESTLSRQERMRKVGRMNRKHPDTKRRPEVAFSGAQNYSSSTPRQLILVEPYWEKQKLETFKQYAAFSCYRDMDRDHRSLSAVSRQLKKCVSMIHRWSKINKWTTRIEAYELMRDREKLAAFAQARKSRLDMQLELAQGMAMVGGARVQELLKTIRAREADPTIPLDLSDKDALHYIAEGIKWQRVLDNLATDHVTVETPEMAQERLLREAVSDVTELSRIDPSVPLETRIQWAAVDYRIDPAVLSAAVHGYIDETEGAEN